MRLPETREDVWARRGMIDCQRQMMGDSWMQPEMGAYRAHLRQLDHLMVTAWREAERSRSRAAGTDELLLAVVGHSDSVAAQALRDSGVESERVEAVISQRRRERKDAEELRFTPAAHQLIGCAEGIAAGLGHDEVRPEHLLLAFLWKPECSNWPLEELGSSREQVYAALSARGVDVPQSELPAPDPRKYGPQVKVSLEELSILLDRLFDVLPEGASFTWNRNNEQGWISVTEGLDARHFIQLALHHPGPSPP